MSHFVEPASDAGTPRSLHHCRVSVVIPTYNHGYYLGAAIDSVLGQDYPDVEVVVVDDGSLDDTAAVVARFGDRVKYIYQANQGLSAARNTGIRAATGSYIGLLDADDLYEPRFISEMVLALVASPGAGAVYCGYQFINDRGQLLPQRETRLVPKEDVYRALLDGNFFVPESVLVARTCYQRVGAFDPSLSALEDWDMWLRIARQFDIVAVERVLTRHRVLPGSMSSDPTRMHRNRMAVLEKHLGTAPVPPEAADTVVARAYGRGYLVSAVEYLQGGQRERATECLKHMARVCPALLLEVETFYMLGCGDQPKGWMGDFRSLDLDRQAAVLLSMLESTFEVSGQTIGIARYRRPAFAAAYLSLGLLNYGAGRFRESRRFLARSTLANPRGTFTPRILKTMFKSLPVANQIVRRYRTAASG